METLDIASAVLLAGGCFFALTGSVGVLRMPDFFARLHPAGKSDTLAQMLVMGGLMCQCDDPLVMLKLASLSLLLFVTAPTSTHAISKAARLDREADPALEKSPSLTPQPQTGGGIDLDDEEGHGGEMSDA